MDRLKRAKNLLKSARDLYDKDDLAGVAGLSYQAVESAIMHLTNKMNGKVSSKHTNRRKRAELLLNLSQNSLKGLWVARNIDFYGNERIYGEERELNKKEIEIALEEAERIIIHIEEFLRKR